MKKLLVIMLVLAMVFGMSGVAFATEVSPTYEDCEDVPIKKDVTLGNPGTVNPAETFEFAVGEGEGLRDGKSISAPAFETAAFTINVGQNGTTGSYDLQLPEFTQVGVYTYSITEQGGNTAGMAYSGETNNLVVTVINNPTGDGFLRVVTIAGAEGNKVDAFTNTFNAGDLTINKVITGNFVDPDDEFTITVTVTPDEGKVINEIPIVWNTDDVTVANGIYTAVYKLTGGNSVTIENLPYDVSYEVVETKDSRYDEPEYDDNADRDMDAAAIETTITNNRDTDVQTGVNLDNLPYIIILIGAIGGLFVFTIRKRFAK